MRCPRTPRGSVQGETTASEEDDCVRELIGVGSLQREDLRRVVRGTEDALHRAPAKIAVAEGRLHGPTKILPLFVRDPLAIPAVCHQSYMVIGKKHVDEDTGVVLRVPHPEIGEEVECPLASRLARNEGRGVEASLYREPQLATMRPLRRPR